MGGVFDSFSSSFSFSLISNGDAYHSTIRILAGMAGLKCSMEACVLLCFFPGETND